MDLALATLFLRGTLLCIGLLFVLLIDGLLGLANFFVALLSFFLSGFFRGLFRNLFLRSLFGGGFFRNLLRRRRSRGFLRRSGLRSFLLLHWKRRILRNDRL